MNLLTIVGNLGADAKVNTKDGQSFVTFNVADNDSYTGQDGVTHERIQWVSCTMNGDGGKLLPFLVKGRSVLVVGRASTRVYSSAVERKMMAGLNISVLRVELLGGQVEEVPRELIAETGEIFRTNKAYYVTQEQAKLAGATKKQNGILVAKKGGRFAVDYNGWIMPIREEAQPQDAATADNAGDNSK